MAVVEMDDLDDAKVFDEGMGFSNIVSSDEVE